MRSKLRIRKSITFVSLTRWVNEWLASLGLPKAVNLCATLKQCSCGQQVVCLSKVGKSGGAVLFHGPLPSFYDMKKQIHELTYAKIIALHNAMLLPDKEIQLVPEWNIDLVSWHWTDFPPTSNQFSKAFQLTQLPASQIQKDKLDLLFTRHEYPLVLKTHLLAVYNLANNNGAI